jgi:hypothetical protein
LGSSSFNSSANRINNQRESRPQSSRPSVSGSSGIGGVVDTSSGITTVSMEGSNNFSVGNVRRSSSTAHDESAVNNQALE